MPLYNYMSFWGLPASRRAGIVLLGFLEDLNFLFYYSEVNISSWQQVLDTSVCCQVTTEEINKELDRLNLGAVILSYPLVLKPLLPPPLPLALCPPPSLSLPLAPCLGSTPGCCSSCRLVMSQGSRSSVINEAYLVSFIKRFQT